jgi:hypothetical protein
MQRWRGRLVLAGREMAETPCDFNQEEEPDVSEDGAVPGEGAAGVLALLLAEVEGAFALAGAALFPDSDPASEAGALVLAA